MALELVIVIALILLNGFFALAEMALVSARRGRLKALARRDKGAKAALALMEQPSRFLSTVQVGITLVGVMASAVGGATLAERIEAGLAASPTFGPYASAIGVGVVVVGVTVLTLILGELVPKRLALGNPERIAARVSGLMALLARIFSPVVTALQVSSSGVIRLFGVKAESAAAVTEEEIRHMVREGAETGAILTVEREMVDRIFRLGDKLVDDVMTPRPQMVTLDAEEPLSENLRRMRDAGYSRYPVMRGEECIGILRAKDVAVEIEKGASLDWLAKLRTPLFVPETTPALGMLDLFKKAGLHMAVVVDEYGDVVGLATQTDILEAIVGEIATAGAPDEASIFRRDDGSWLVDALVPADELKERLELHELPGEAEHDFNTVAGLMLARFERIPREGDHFEWSGLRFEVIDMDGRRIDKVLITPLAKPVAEAS